MSNNAHEIDITGLDAAKVLAALYNAALPLGLGWLQATGDSMTREEAAMLLEIHVDRNVQHDDGAVISRFDYVRGRPIKVWIHRQPSGAAKISGALLYDRDHGAGACAEVVAKLRDAETGAVAKAMP